MSELTLKDVLGFDPNQATTEQLDAAIVQIDQLKSAANAQKERVIRANERRRNRRKRAEYQLAKPIYRTEYNRTKIVDAMISHFEKNALMTHSEFERILLPNRFSAKNNFNEVYTCPDCGETSLYVTDSERPKLRVVWCMRLGVPSYRKHKLGRTRSICNIPSQTRVFG